MTFAVDIPGERSLALEHLLLDVNGTLTKRGELLDGVAERLARLCEILTVHLLSADTFGRLDAVAGELGAERCVAIGNGANDAAMLSAAALGIAVIGPEGAAAAAVRAAEVVCGSIRDALDLLDDERTLVATLRA